MSGAEAIAVLGVISSIISIVDGTKKVYDAATNAQGLPEAFRTIAGRLPVVENILDSAKKRIEQGNVGENSCKGVKDVVEACEKKATKLDTLFKKAMPKNGASDLERYYKAVKAFGKGNEVENLMKGMLVDVQLLACERGIDTATQAQQEQIVKAVKEVSAVLSSVPEHVFQETGFTNTNYGPGTQYNAQGEYVAQGNARQYNSAGGPMHFGSMENDEEACMTALFLTDPKDDREQLIISKGSRVDNTCEWIKSNKLYKSWLDSRSQLLWVSGGPGKGKTMLSIFLAEELERIAEEHSQGLLFLQYFCDNKDEKRNTAITILRGLIFQLLQSRQKLFEHILPRFKIQKESLFTGSSFEGLWRIFESMIRDPILGTVYCVLDGLDECEEASLEMLLKKFAALLPAKTNESSACHLNLIFLSRDLPDFIPKLLSSFPRIRLDPDADTEINNDIDQFIKVKVDGLSKYRQYPESLRVHVKEVFRNRAQGTFLWVGIVAKLLEKYKATEVVKILDLFPSGLNELYARMLLQIDENRRQIAAKIIRWVVMAVRPLTLSELSVVTDTTVTPSDLFSLDVIMRDQVSYCGYFLTIKEDKVGLIHQSAKDYLLRKTHDPNPELEFFRVKEDAADLDIARRCLDYLENGALAGGEVDLEKDVSHLKAFPLLSYAALHWPEHAKSLSRSEDIYDLSRPFYNKKSPIWTSWLKTRWTVELFNDPWPDSFTLLHLASCFGILQLAENLILEKKGLINKLKRKHYLNKMDKQGRTALMLAAQCEHDVMVRLLLEKGADVNIKNRYGGTALHEAAVSGYESTVRLLLEKMTDVNIKDRYGDTALHEAAKFGHESTVRLLLEKGTDVNIKDENGDTALCVAVKFGHEPTVRLLLENGANVNIKDENGDTALHMAVIFGHESVMQLLLEKGAHVDIKDENGDTALQKAIGYERELTVRLLLEKMTDVNIKNIYGDTALHEAAKFGHESTVRLLLEKGTDVNIKDENGDTALCVAVKFGHEPTVRLLLENGANVNIKNRYGDTALCVAVKFGHEPTVRLLLENGANVNIKDENGDTALHMAVTFGHESVMQLLLEKGTDVNIKNENGDTALHEAAVCGYESTVRLLLEKMTDVNIKNRYGDTALHEAAKFGHESTVRLLLEKGTDVNIKDENGDTALQVAITLGHESVMQLLLKKEAHVDTNDVRGFFHGARPKKTPPDYQKKPLLKPLFE